MDILQERTILQPIESTIIVLKGNNKFTWITDIHVYILLWLKILLLAAQSCFVDHLFHLNIALKMSLNMPFQVCDDVNMLFDIYFFFVIVK